MSMKTWPGPGPWRLALVALASLCPFVVGRLGHASSQIVPGVHPNQICTTCDPPPDPEPTPRPRPSPTPKPSLTTIIGRYQTYDINADGRTEINSFKPLFPNQPPYSVTPHGVAIVLVNADLVADNPNIHVSRADMLASLGQLSSDMSADGFFPLFVEAGIYAGPVHQDGRTVLALRRFVKDVWLNYPVAGVLFVGSFPDASIVRSVFVKENAYADQHVSFTSGSQSVTEYLGHFLALGPEYVTPRAEIVIGDMDGNWEALYHEQPFTVPYYRALPFEPSASYPQSGQVIDTSQYSETINTFEDVFFIQDHEVATSTSGGWLHLVINSLDEPSPEVNDPYHSLPNRIAIPEMQVSRIDPLRVAVMPTAPPDLDGKSPLDAAGHPQKLRFSYAADITWERDRTLERQLVADYIARSHRLRFHYHIEYPFRTSAIRAKDSGLVSPAVFNNRLRGASNSFEASTGVDEATLLDYVNWLGQPAVLKGIAAHSDTVNSRFGAELYLDVEVAAGAYDYYTRTSHAWRWAGHWEGPNWILEPTFAGMNVDANFYLHRTMWENGFFAAADQTFYVHEGCEVMRPRNAEHVPYNDPSYGREGTGGNVANGESLMFYTNGLGLMARNKVFNDIPQGFYETMKNNGERFGYGWRGYFLHDADDGGLDERGANPVVVTPGNDRRDRTLQRKRSYFWNVIGDFTLRIRY